MEVLPLSSFVKTRHAWSLIRYLQRPRKSALSRDRGRAKVSQTHLKTLQKYKTSLAGLPN